jgi:hypothetical protein
MDARKVDCDLVWKHQTSTSNINVVSSDKLKVQGSTENDGFSFVFEASVMSGPLIHYYVGIHYKRR